MMMIQQPRVPDTDSAQVVGRVCERVTELVETSLFGLGLQPGDQIVPVCEGKYVSKQRGEM